MRPPESKPENLLTPKDEPSQLELAKMWTDDVNLQTVLAGIKTYVKKLAHIGNSGSLSIYSIENNRINHLAFNDNEPRTVLDASTGKLTKDTFYDEFSRRNRRIRAITKINERKKKIGSGIELLLSAISEIIFEEIFNQKLASIPDNMEELSDSVLFSKSQDTEPFIFGLDYTINSSSKDSRSNIPSKLKKILVRIHSFEAFLIKYMEHPTTGEKIFAFNVPKLLFYINPDKLEEIAESYYKKDNKRVRELLDVFKDELLVSLYLQTVLFSKYAAQCKNYDICDSYMRLRKILVKKIPREKRTLTGGTGAYTEKLISEIIKLYNENIVNV